MPGLGLHCGLRNVYGCVICGDATRQHFHVVYFQLYSAFVERLQRRWRMFAWPSAMVRWESWIRRHGPSWQVTASDGKCTSLEFGAFLIMSILKQWKFSYYGTGLFTPIWFRCARPSVLSFDWLWRNSFADANNTNAPGFSTVSQNLFVFFPNAYGFMVSIWLNMAAVKLQYSDRMATSLRSSFVQLLDDNRKSFRGLDRREVIKDDTVIMKDDNAPVHTFANLRKMALEIATQKIEAPAPHEKVVIGCKLWLIPNILHAQTHSHTFTSIWGWSRAIVVAFWLVVVSLLSFLKVSLEQWKLVVGIIANINTFFFYGAPLSTIVTVLKTRDSWQVHY